MPKIAYRRMRFFKRSKWLIAKANEIIGEYQAVGLVLTLRQLYYQFVSRDWLPNSQKSYDSLGGLMNDARIGGLVDWNAIEDRTRGPVVNTHWESPESIIGAAARSYMRDRWEGQQYRVEVWIEKEALAGVLEANCADLDTLFLACRGYTSVSELWRAAMRMKRYASEGYKVAIIHLGDHDPSGIDMTRDIRDRLELFLGASAAEQLEVRRIALNYDQVQQYNPPPNPAKTQDPRFKEYQQQFGDTSWELDALNPNTLKQLVDDAVSEFRNDALMDSVKSREEKERIALTQAKDRWNDVVTFLNKKPPKKKGKKNAKAK